MEMPKEASNKLEWRINVPDGTQEVLVPESGSVFTRVWSRLESFLVRFVLTKISNFLKKAWSIAINEPKKVIHGIKVGLALTIVSLFYYMRPLYDGFGGNAMWAVMTVVVVFEYTVGATLCKCINRATGTLLAGALGLGVHWVASRSGEHFEPVILGVSVFVFASAATFSRFIPSIKARFDYGALIFILTFSLVSVSGYRVEELFDLAHQRLSTIAIGTSLCILTSMLCCPIWAGQELHSSIHRNMEKLADSLDGCITEYFSNGDEEDIGKKVGRYKCVLNSRATEESMANFAKWEPPHGRFNFRHPWKQYLAVGASLRSCACCIETLNGCINSEIQAPECLKKHISDVCMTFSSRASNVLKELAITMKTYSMSSNIELSVDEMQFAAEELQNTLRSLPNQHLTLNPSMIPSSGDSRPELTIKTYTPPIMELLPIVTVVSLLVETAARIEEIVETVNELAAQAVFTPVDDGKTDQPCNKLNSTDYDCTANKDHQAMKTPPKV